MVVKGPWMQRLGEYVQGADVAAVDALIQEWHNAGERFGNTGTMLPEIGKQTEDGFSAASESGVAARRDMETAGTKTEEKSEVIAAAVHALRVVRGETMAAINAKATLEATLPASHDPVPPESSFNTAQGGGTSAGEAKENQQAYGDAQKAHAEREAAIAEAERVAAERVQAVDVSVEEAEPKVRALYDDGSDSNTLPPGTSASPGSASQVGAAEGRMAKYNSGVMYPGGWGQDLQAEERANIEAYKAENKPEWNGNEWVNADGTAAPATSYAMVETADGLAPLSGGTSGMSALAIGGGGALLGAGVAKAIANKFGGGAAKAATAGAASRSAAAKAGTAGARAGAGAAGRGAGARGAGAGARGAGARGAGAGGRGAKGGPAGAGSRAGRGGAGGAGGRGGKKKDDKQNGQDQDWQADYTDDWTDPNYKASPTVIGDEWKRRKLQQDDE